jgi:hypothetical protein
VIFAADPERRPGFKRRQSQPERIARWKSGEVALSQPWVVTVRRASSKSTKLLLHEIFTVENL